MGISLKPEHVKRYTQIARLLAKYGRSDLVRNAGLEEVLPGDVDVPVEVTVPEAEELASDLEAMGPTFTKLGQLLSTRVDLIPLPYAEALSRLQDSVGPFPFSDVERILFQELGVRPSKAFLELEAVPMAAASLGQVHRARLRNGRRVAVKVQRPNIREQVAEDLDALGEIVAFLTRHSGNARRYDLVRMHEEMRRTLLRELDYRQEARNLATLAENLAEFPGIFVPLPVDDYTTSRVLTMDFVPGRKITEVSALARLEMDTEQLAGQLFEAYLKQILVDGFFHADPHPGNVFLTTDRRVALLDVGMVGRVSPGLQDELLHLLLSISEGRGEEAAEVMIGLSEHTDEFDPAAFERQMTDMVVRYRDASADQIQIGRVMIQVTRAAAENGMRVPPELTVLGKTLLNLDQVGRALDPDFEPNAFIRRNSAELMRRRMVKNASPANMLSNLLEANEFVQRLPGRLNRVLDAVAESEMEVRIRIMNETVMMEGLQKIANRITVGLVIAALVIGAAMLMRVETSVRIFGYPALAMVLFLAAAVGGLILVFNILSHDRHSTRGGGGKPLP